MRIQSKGRWQRQMPKLTHEEIALLKHYRAGERTITGLERSQAHQRLLKLGYIEEQPLNLMDSRITITSDGRSALLDL
jgi:hypothetical protein